MLAKTPQELTFGAQAKCIFIQKAPDHLLYWIYQILGPLLEDSSIVHLMHRCSFGGRIEHGDFPVVMRKTFPHVVAVPSV